VGCRRYRPYRLHYVRPFRVPLLIIGLLIATLPPTSFAYAQNDCWILCAPTVKIEPTLTFSNLAARHRVRQLPDGEPQRAARDSTFEVILAADIPTQAPRLGFTIEAIWTRNDPLELELETNLIWLTSRQTRGWVSSHFDIVDKYSPSERPGDTRPYTHKLNFELDTAVAIFNRLPDGWWLRRLELEGSLDYVATGLPKQGDEIPAGVVFQDDASPWSFSLVVVIPLAPLR
jgi:hypothetical protein